MGVIDIICGIVLILASIMIIALVSMQESKRGMSALTGGCLLYTSYLVGTMDKWNDAKKAEEHDRVKHGLSCGCK